VNAIGSTIRRAALAALLCALLAPGMARAHHVLDEANALPPDYAVELAEDLRGLESRTGVRVGVALLGGEGDIPLAEAREAFGRLREGGSPDPREALVVIHGRKVLALNLGGELRGKMHSGGMLERLRRIDGDAVEVALHRRLAALVGKVAPGDPLAAELSEESVRLEAERRRLAARAAMWSRVKTWGLVGLILTIVIGTFARWRILKRRAHV